MTDPIRWGILGTGWISGAFTRDLRAQGAAVAAVGSRTRGAADAFAASYGIPNAHASYRALVDDPTVHAIYVSTPHPFHAQNAKLALAAGKHVLVEKPFTLNAAEAREVVDLAEERGLVVLEAMWTRWLPHMVRVREILAAGTLGDIRTVIATHDDKLAADPTNRIYAPGLGGGALLDLGVYPVSLAWDVLGAPQTVMAMSTPTDTGVDRQTSVLLGYASGAHAVVHTALDTLNSTTATILGTAGRIEIDDLWYCPTSFTVYDDQGAVLERFDEPVTGRGMQYQAAELGRLVAAGVLAGEVLPPRESVQIMATLDEIRRQIGLRYPGESQAAPGIIGE